MQAFAYCNNFIVYKNEEVPNSIILCDDFYTAVFKHATGTCRT